MTAVVGMWRCLYCRKGGGGQVQTFIAFPDHVIPLLPFPRIRHFLYLKQIVSQTQLVVVDGNLTICFHYYYCVLSIFTFKSVIFLCIPTTIPERTYTTIMKATNEQ